MPSPDFKSQYYWKKLIKMNWAWWQTPVRPALGKLGQEDLSLRKAWTIIQ
jgi:hypothetical protein